MLNKVFAGFVVVFWATMMAALVRVEIFPKPTILDSYPTERVLRKIFANPTPARLSIYQRGNYKDTIGSCRIDIRPRRDGDLGEELLPGQQPDAYEVTSELNMRLSMFGMPSRVRVTGQSTFDQNLDLKNFAMTTRIGARQWSRGGGDTRNSDVRNGMGRGFGEIRMTGDDVTRKVRVELDFGDVRDERTFDFNQVRDAGFASAFGLPGLSSFQLAGNSGGPGSSRVDRPATISTYFDRLDIAGSWQRTYLIDWRISDQMWTKVWVSQGDGEVLKVSTSLGLEMVSDIMKGGVSP